MEIIRFIGILSLFFTPVCCLIALRLILRLIEVLNSRIDRIERLIEGLYDDDDDDDDDTVETNTNPPVMTVNRNGKIFM